MRKHARLRYNIQLRQGGLGLFSPESFGNAAFIGGMLACEDAVRRHFSGCSPEEPPSQVPSHLAKTRLLTQLCATAQDFVEVGLRCYGNAYDASVAPADRAEGYDRWFDKPNRGIKLALAALTEGKWTELKCPAGSQKVCSLLSNSSLVEKVEASFYPYRLPYPAEIKDNKCNLANLLVDGASIEGVSTNDRTNARNRLANWIAQSNEFSGVWLTGAHAKSCSAGMSEVPRLFKDALLSYLDLPISDHGVGNYECGGCKKKCATSGELAAHAEGCKSSQRMHTHRHTEIQHCYEIVVGKIPGVSWRRESPLISEYFPVRAWVEGDVRDQALRQRADMALRVGNDGEILVDFTVGGVCCQTHWPRQGVRAGIANHIADVVKGTTHRVFEATPDVLVGIGFDSRGGMSKTTRDLHKRLFATEGWRSQALRAWVYRTHLTRISAVLWKFRGKVSRCAFDKRADGVVPPSGPPEDGTPSTPPATSSSASSSGSSGRDASASSQSSISLDEEGVFAEAFNRLQGGGQSYPSSLSSLSQTWM